MMSTCELRMENNFRTAHRGPADRFRITPSFMADRHSELHSVHFKKLPRISVNIELIFGWIQLIFCLISLNLSFRIENISRNLTAIFRDSFYSENCGNGILSRVLRNLLERFLLFSSIIWKYFKILPA